MNPHGYTYTYLGVTLCKSMSWSHHIHIKTPVCDWIMENRPKCHTWPIPLLAQLIATLIHCPCTVALTSLACFPKAGFADHMKSRLAQWGSWRAPDSRYGSDIHPVLMTRFVGPPG